MISRKTKQKAILKKIVESTKTFFSAEDIFKEAKKEDPKIGIATIYRFLKESAENNVIHSYKCDRRLIYSKEQNNHCHFVCQNCQKNEHFKIEKLDFIKSKIKGSICHFELHIHGLCKSCSKKSQ